MLANDRLRFRPQLQGFEDRCVPAVLTGAVPTLQAAAIVIDSGEVSLSRGDLVASFLQRKLGTRVGGGECAHIATEGLRAAGADFTRTEPAGTRDYVWTTNRVARLTNGGQLAGKRFWVGDIIQYHNATFSAGSFSKLAHHTQVVAAVNSAGRITQVYEQNVNGNRTVQRRTAPDLSKLSGGSVSVYRPMARLAQSGRVEYTIVNNTGFSRTYTLQIGSSTSNTTLDRANTEGSYRVRSATFSGGARPVLKVGTSSVTVQDGAAYELYTMGNGQVGIRRI